MSRWLALAVGAVACILVTLPAQRTAGEDAVRITSHVSYDVRPDQGPVRVLWDVTFQNNDPATTNGGDGETEFFYETLTIPVLRGASGLLATASTGEPLAVALGERGAGPTVTATVSFHRHVFFGEMYGFTLAYELANVREPSVLVTPTYAYLPVIAGGDEATVTVVSPSGSDWSVSLEAEECAQNGATFTCSGADAAFLAALVEVSRPDAVASFSFDTLLKEKAVSVTLSYFQGEEATSQHLKDLVRAALPLMEDVYGFPYPGPATVSVSQGGRQAALGYEGLASCDPAGACSVVVSPAADDITVLHELAHFWSSIYSKRWLSEAFAQLVAEETASALPPGLVQRQPPAREPAAVDVRLDEWGDVSSLIGAAESAVDVENAGYDRSLRFLYVLRSTVGSDVLKRVNAAIAAGQSPADSKRYLDLLEELSQRPLDDLFAEWVFPPSMKPTLAVRRELRDRLETLARRVADEGMSESEPHRIRAHVDAWQFDSARVALDDAEAELVEYDDLKATLSRLTAEAEAEGLLLPASIRDAMRGWEFVRARSMLSAAAAAVDAYASARQRVDTPRNLWERFGLWGANPNEKLEEASATFADGDFRTALDRANEATDLIGSASQKALRRLLFLGLVFASIAVGTGIAVWMSQQREKDLAEL